MNTSQIPAPINKKEYITAIGALLVLEHGKKNNYLPEEIQEAHKKSRWFNPLDIADDVSFLAIDVFSKRVDFDSFYQKTESASNHIAIKSEISDELSTSYDSILAHVTPINTDTYGLDLEEVLDSVFTEVAEFISHLAS